MQRESTFRLMPVSMTDEGKAKVQEIRELAIKLYDAIDDIQIVADISFPNGEIKRCVATAKTKLQEATMWATRGASYVGKKYTEI